VRVLVIGGTKFLGPHLVDRLTARGHAVTLFNRGKSGLAVQAGIELVVGDRESDIESLAGRRFDSVIDTCGFFPRIVRLAAKALAPAVGHYAFISTISVYADPLDEAADEGARLATLADPTVEELTGETYGPLKAMCEQAVRDEIGAASLVIRPGLIVGPLDPTDRFTYWPHRFARGGEALVPGAPSHPISVIDVRDLAAFAVGAVERGLGGTFNAAGDPALQSMGGLVDACVAAAGAQSAKPVWVDEAFLASNGVEPWSDLPAWLPPGSDSLMHARSDRAVAAGLVYRPMLDTARDTLAWSRERGLERTLKAGLTSEREERLLAAYRGQSVKT
jgi:2'-hydroxyisoflavone reductase